MNEPFSQPDLQTLLKAMREQTDRANPRDTFGDVAKDNAGLATELASFERDSTVALLACRALADTAQGLTGTQIGRLLQEIQVQPSTVFSNISDKFTAVIA